MSGLKWSSLAQSYTRCLIALLILQSSQILGQSVDNFDIGFTWVHVDVRNGIPANAVQGGLENGRQPSYIGRAIHEGDLIPGKVIPAYRYAYVPYDGKEYLKHDVEVLVQSGVKLQWVAATNGHVPPNAVVGGYTVYGEILFIGRAYYRGTTTIGKIQISHRGMYTPFAGREVFLSDYEVLVRNYTCP